MLVFEIWTLSVLSVLSINENVYINFDCYTFGQERVCMRYCACWVEYALKSVGHQNTLRQAFHCIGGSRLLSSYSYQTWLSYSKFDICLHSNLAHTARDLFRHKVPASLTVIIDAKITRSTERIKTESLLLYIQMLIIQKDYIHVYPIFL